MNNISSDIIKLFEILKFNDNLRFSVGASNILDEDPVYTSSAGTAPGNGNTFPGYFDALGTYIFVNATFEL